MLVRGSRQVPWSSTSLRGLETAVVGVRVGVQEWGECLGCRSRTRLVVLSPYPKGNGSRGQSDPLERRGGTKSCVEGKHGRWSVTGDRKVCSIESQRCTLPLGTVHVTPAHEFFSRPSFVLHSCDPVLHHRDLCLVGGD